MSYVIQIWDQPNAQAMPASVAEAERMLGELSQQQPGQNAKFVALVQRLTTRYPCICSAEAEELPESEWAWSDGPLNGHTTSALLSLGAATRHLDEVLPFVVVSANALRLNVFDAQAGAVYLADGKVIGNGSARPSDAGTPADQDLPTEAELRDALFDELEPLLAQFGFKGRKRGVSFKRVFQGGWQTLELCTFELYNPRRVGYGVDYRARLDAVNELLDEVLSRPGTEHDKKLRWSMSCELSELIYGVGAALSVSRRKDIPSEMVWLKTQFQDRVLPLLNNLQTVSGFDEMLNCTPLTQGIFYYGNPLDGSRHIVVSFLADSPKLPEICAEFEANAAPYPLSDQANETRKCIQYVRSRLAGNDA